VGGADAAEAGLELSGTWEYGEGAGPSGGKGATMARRAASIQGDVTVEETRLNTKGGSMTAILRKKLSEALGRGGTTATGARFDFGQLGSVILLVSNRIKGGRIQVTRMNDRRFVVDLVDKSAVTVEPLTRAFLTIIAEQFKHGQRRLVDRDRAFAELEGVEQAPAVRARG
jgi:hypothetical protein